MPVVAKELSALAVSKLVYPKGKEKKPVKFAVGGVSGLLLQITPNNARSWILRTVVGENRKEIGLGSYPAVSLKDARDRANAAKIKIQEGVDPTVERIRARAALISAQKRGLTFSTAMEMYLESVNVASLKNDKHKQQWRSSLETYARPIIGKKFVGDIEVADLLLVLEPIWTEKTETASRIRGRIEAILAWATVKGYRDGDNPARWRGNLKEALPAPSKVAKNSNFPAVQIKEVSSWFSELKQREGISARALEFLTFTAARSGEVRGATWSEIDFEEKMWTIPKDRMKAGKEHRVPLVAEAIELLKKLSKDSKFIFPSTNGEQLSDMALSAVMRRMQSDAESKGHKGWVDRKSGRAAVPHGLRSTFRDWAGELTDYPRDMIEMAMAHAIGSEVESAYRRGDMFQKRRQLMADWVRYLSGVK